MRLSEHFEAWEFKCKCGVCESVLPDPELIEVLEDVRGKFGKPVTVHSGYRCDDYNRSVGGAKHSQHKNAKAGDITVEDTPPDVVHGYLIDRYPDQYGIGSYATFTHVDVRDSKARW